MGLGYRSWHWLEQTPAPAESSSQPHVETPTMPLYKNSEYFIQSENVAFDGLHEPGQEAPFPGIYRCNGCGKEVAMASGQRLPQQNHHQHTSTQGRIRWQLVVSHG
jgi:hypothetical protein